jgi:hypothetical protein
MEQNNDDGLSGLLTVIFWLVIPLSLAAFLISIS